MLIEIQSEILTFLRIARLRDNDGFAARAARIYLERRRGISLETTVAAILRIRTSTFASSRGQRRTLTEDLVRRMDTAFKARLPSASIERMRPTGKERSRVLALSGRVRAKAAGSAADGSLAFQQLIENFKAAVESHSISPFWKSRRSGELRPQPEELAQQSLMMFLSEPMKSLAGFVLREVASGIGFIDVMAVFGPSQRYVVELKVRSGPRITGRGQLRRYLKTAGLTEGWLVLFDARPGRKAAPRSTVADGISIHAISIDLNPAAPSSLG